MAGIKSVEIQTLELKKIAATIKGLDITDPRLGHAIGNMLVRSTRERIIKTKKSPKNETWESRRADTIIALERAKAREDITNIGTLLHVTGNLAKIQYSVAKFKFNGELSISSKAEYSGYLQDGTKNMPARPFLGLSVKDYMNIRKMFVRHVRSQLGDK